MAEPLENLYFNWLCAKVIEIGPNPNYYDLFILLHKTEFTWIVPADRHRSEEGKELRISFFMETDLDRDSIFEQQPCSMFEFLIAFSKRASFQTDIPLQTWFWEFMNNLRLDEYRRMSSLQEVWEVEDILRTFMWRQYAPDGTGGMFPMLSMQHDQRDIEIWYQFSDYLEDRGLF